MRYSLSHGLSETGNVRPNNQDAIRFHEPQDKPTLESHGMLYAVADGMGGYEHGDLASSLALETFFKTFYAGTPNKSPQTLRQGIKTANQVLMQEAQRLQSRMGTTLSAINLVGHECHIAHIGDSRIYQVRGRKGVCLTKDHTAVGQLVRMRLLSPDKVRTHERRSMLEKCLGLHMFVQPDVQRCSVEEGDYFVLCTDGIWGYVEDDEFTRIVQESRHPEAIGASLFELALSRESDDNLSVLVIQVQKLYTPSEVQAPANSGLRPLLRSWLYGKN